MTKEIVNAAIFNEIIGIHHECIQDFLEVFFKFFLYK